MNGAISVPAPAPTQDEMTMALLAHILQIFTWWIGPLVIYLVKRDSKFVSFHAMQALLWQICIFILSIVGICLGLFLIFATVFPHAGRPVPSQAPPPAFFIMFPIMWLGIMAISITNIVLGVVFAVKASRGEWASYPVIGHWARRIVGV